MSPLIIDTLTNLGVLGPVLAIFAIYIWKQHQDLRSTEAKRAEEMRETLSKIIDLSNKWYELQNLYFKGLEANTCALHKIQELLEEKVKEEDSLVKVTEGDASIESLYGYVATDRKRV